MYARASAAFARLSLAVIFRCTRRAKANSGLHRCLQNTNFYHVFSIFGALCYLILLAEIVKSEAVDTDRKKPKGER